MVLLQFLIPIRNIRILPWDRKKTRYPVWLWERAAGWRTEWNQHNPEFSGACRTFAAWVTDLFAEAGCKIIHMPEPNGFTGLAVSAKDCAMLPPALCVHLTEQKTFCHSPKFFLEEEPDAVLCERICEELFSIFEKRDYVPGKTTWTVRPLRGDNIHRCADCGKLVTDRTAADPVECLPAGHRDGKKFRCPECASSDRMRLNRHTGIPFADNREYNSVGFSERLQESVRVVRNTKDGRLYCKENIPTGLVWEHPKYIGYRDAAVALEDPVFEEVYHTEIEQKGWAKYLPQDGEKRFVIDGDSRRLINMINNAVLGGQNDRVRLKKAEEMFFWNCKGLTVEVSVDDTEVYRIRFWDVVGYLSRADGFLPDPQYDVYEGVPGICFREYQQSRFLDMMRTMSVADRIAEYRHYGIVTPNGVVDVAAFRAPWLEKAEETE